MVVDELRDLQMGAPNGFQRALRHVVGLDAASRYVDDLGVISDIGQLSVVAARQAM